GCSSGIGRATAERFAARGFTVFASMRRPEAGASLRALAAEKGWRLTTPALDVARDDSVAEAVAAVLGETDGRLDVLVNNAGYYATGPLEEITPDELRAQLETNVIGVHRVTRAVLPAMRARGSGAIVTLGSLSGRVALPVAGAYHASKWALEGMIEAWRLELGPFGIRVTLIEPGPFATAFYANERLAAARVPTPGSWPPTDASLRVFPDPPTSARWSTPSSGRPRARTPGCAGRSGRPPGRSGYVPSSPTASTSGSCGSLFAPGRAAFPTPRARTAIRAAKTHPCGYNRSRVRQALARRGRLRAAPSSRDRRLAGVRGAPELRVVERGRGRPPGRGSRAAASGGRAGAGGDAARGAHRARGAGGAHQGAGRQPRRRQPGGERAPRDRAARRRPLPARAAHDRAPSPRRPRRVGARPGALARAGPLARLLQALRLRPGDPGRDHPVGRSGGSDRGHLQHRSLRHAARALRSDGDARRDGLPALRRGRGADGAGLRRLRHRGPRRRRCGGGRHLRPRAPPLPREPQPRVAGPRALPRSAHPAPPPPGGSPAAHARVARHRRVAALEGRGRQAVFVDRALRLFAAGVMGRGVVLARVGRLRRRRGRGDLLE